MNKKLLLVSLAGLSVVLSGCTFPGAQDEEAMAQTRMLEQMQQQISTLLSGVETLRAQNEQMSGRLAEMYYTEQDIPLSPTDQKRTEEVTSLFASGFDIEKNFPSSGTGISELVIPSPDEIKAIMPDPDKIKSAMPSSDEIKSIMSNSGMVNDESQTGLVSAKTSTGPSVLDELRKASKEKKPTTSGSQTKPLTGSK